MKPTFNEHTVLDGYRLIRFIGRGGFGEVWLCRSEVMGDYRALKMISTSNPGHLEKEYQSLLHYRNAAARLRSPHLVAIEHVNHDKNGLYYIMPLADGLGSEDPGDPDWVPMSLAAKIEAQRNRPGWFSSREIVDTVGKILQALQTVSDAGLVHRDVKPDNILYFNGQPCLGDVSLLGEDAAIITRRGTPGYGTPSWYIGGHPDMYGAAATLYTLLTGNSPDKMGRTAFLWPPQGQDRFSESERSEWKRLHGVIRRATEEAVAERYVDFNAMAKDLEGVAPEKAKPSKAHMTMAVLGMALMVMLVIAWMSRPVGESRAQDSGEAQAPRTLSPGGGATGNPPELTDEEKADYRAMAAMVQAYMEDGKYENALACIETLWATYPQSRDQPSYSIARAMALQSLGRIDEAKDELKKEVHLSPQIAPMTARKKIWEELGDLNAAEHDLTRILDKYGLNTFVLYLRADVRAQRGNIKGVHADRQLAYKANPKELEQRKLVDSMWAAYEADYPAYKQYLENTKPKTGGRVDGALKGLAGIKHDDAWVLEVFDSIVDDIVNPGVPYSQSAMKSRRMISGMMRDSYQKGDYATTLGLLERTTHSIPALAKTPVLSLFRALLLKRLGRDKETGAELIRLCHRDDNPRLIEARISLLNALDRKQEARELLTRMIQAIQSSGQRSGEQSIRLLKQRARINVVMGDFGKAHADYAEALALAAQLPDKKHALGIKEAGKAMERIYPGYQSDLEK
ncbi:MAG: hypothetical protein H7A51_07870 [Akkermansiaceae bacterium]|nr:hypothetical protein [Akkermansiaceae bacterium]